MTPGTPGSSLAPIFFLWSRPLPGALPHRRSLRAGLVAPSSLARDANLTRSGRRPRAEHAAEQLQLDEPLLAEHHAASVLGLVVIGDESGASAERLGGRLISTWRPAAAFTD